MEELKHQVELILGVNDIPQPETREHACWDQKESTKTDSAVVKRDTYLTIFG